MEKDLIQKYNVAAPRYTSYPTVPFWDKEQPDVNRWLDCVKQTFSETNNKDGISLYIHLPFCESLCTYCGCNTRITVNHAVEDPYIKAVIKEWEMYRNSFPDKPRIGEIHLGGGTPTFFSPENLRKLIQSITMDAGIADNFEFGFEAHPGNTTPEHLKTLFELGFRRVSFGIQDFDPKVQDIINRFQTYEDVKSVTDEARRIGYTSINYDLVYGLPLQTMQSIIQTVDRIRELKPDRIAFYSYAHVPWLKPGQRRFTEKDLPHGKEKRALYERGREMLEQVGYVEIGMDHFALKDDSLYVASQQKKLHRNFMGYTTTQTHLMLGLGVSSISDSWNAFAQNVKVVEEYYKLINENKLPVFKGHFLNEEDLILRKHILNIMCRFETSWLEIADQHESLFEGIERMDELQDDGLVEVHPFHLKVTEKGKPFLRNICMVLDARLWRNQPNTEIFSKAV